MIREDFVLTAAHCAELMKRAPWRFKIMVGNYHLKKIEEEEESFEVLDVVVHPGYSSRTLDQDFALIRLHGKSKHTPVKLGDATTKLEEAHPLTGMLISRKILKLLSILKHDSYSNWMGIN